MANSVILKHSYTKFINVGKKHSWVELRFQPPNNTKHLKQFTIADTLAVSQVHVILKLLLSNRFSLKKESVCVCVCMCANHSIREPELKENSQSHQSLRDFCQGLSSSLENTLNKGFSWLQYVKCQDSSARGHQNLRQNRISDQSYSQREDMPYREDYWIKLFYINGKIY